MKGSKITADEWRVLRALSALVVESWFENRRSANDGLIFGGSIDQLGLPRYWLKTGKAAFVCESLVRKGLLTRQVGDDGYRREGWKLKGLTKAQKEDLWYAPHPDLTESPELYQVLAGCAATLPVEFRQKLLAEGLRATLGSMM